MICFIGVYLCAGILFAIVMRCFDNYPISYDEEAFRIGFWPLTAISMVLELIFPCPYLELDDDDEAT